MINWKNVPTNLSHLKSKVDKIDVDKLVPLPADLSKLSLLVKKFEDKIPDFINLATNTALNAKINAEIHSVTNLAETAALNSKVNDI